MMRSRAGFALLTVLWLTVAASLVVLATERAARDAVQAAANRVDSERAWWRANDCLERERMAIDQALDDAKRESAALTIWRRLDLRVGRARLEDCAVQMQAIGSRLDVNTASDAQLRSLFRNMRLPGAEGLAEALLDWRDVDDDARVEGAERDWYESQRRLPPRNGPLADVRELARVRGFGSLSGLDSVLSVDSARICINSATMTVLATLPGFTNELLARIALERDAGRDITDVLALAAAVSRPAADSILAHYPEIAQLTTTDPDAWIMRAVGWAGSPPLSVAIEAKLLLADGRAAVVRRRVLP